MNASISERLRCEGRAPRAESEIQYRAKGECNGYRSNREIKGERLDEAASDGDPQRGILPACEGTLRCDLSSDTACHGFTIIAKIIPGREEIIREYGRNTKLNNMP